MQDERVDLWELSLREIHSGNLRYILQGKPQRGATCFVYPAVKLEMVGETVFEHRILLKEFYPLLQYGKRIQRKEDGFLEIPEYIAASEECKQAFKRFQDDYRVILEIRNGDKGAEYLPVPMGIKEMNGTWYLEVAYDSGKTLEELMAERSFRGIDYGEFLRIFEKCARMVGRLHNRGYYHLDLKPQNITQTREKTIKLIDADTFLSQKDLENAPMLYYSEGYSAPEIGMAAEMPEDAPYLIGPWTDIYSLCQILCWFLYGRPLSEEELEEHLEKTEELIKERFADTFPVRALSSCGLYRLKTFLRKNLDHKMRKRDQEILFKFFDGLYGDSLPEGEMIDEIKKIQEYSCYKLFEPMDNFREWKGPFSGSGEDIAALEEWLIGKEEEFGIVWDGYGILAGGDREVREETARYYATKHRLEYSDIVEIRCDNFEGILEKVPVYQYNDLPYRGEIQNPHQELLLFLVFDEQEKNVLSKKEAEDLKKLLAVPKSQTLIVGKHNRCANRNMDFEVDVEKGCVTLDAESKAGYRSGVLEDSELEELLKLAREEEGVKGWSWKRPLRQGILMLLLLAAGGLTIWMAGNWADKWIYFDAAQMVYVKRPWWQITGPMVLHLLGSGVCMAGVTAGYYLVFDLVTPRGLWYFYKEYAVLWAAGWSTIAALTMPDIFWEISWDILCQLFGMRHWMAIDMTNMVFKGALQIAGNLVFALWFCNILWFQKYRWKLLKIAGNVVLIAACAYMVFQTLGNFWELLLFGLLLWATGWLISMV